MEKTHLSPTEGPVPAVHFRVSTSLHCMLSRSPCLQVWLKPVAEMSYLYGNNVLKSGLGRMTEHTPAHTGL